MPVLKEIRQGWYGITLHFTNGTYYNAAHDLEIDDSLINHNIEFVSEERSNTSGRVSDYITSIRKANMPQITVTPKYVNEPKEGKRYGSINADGTYYSFDAKKIPTSTFQKGVAIDIEYVQNEQGYNSITRVRQKQQAPAAPGISGTMPTRGGTDPNAMSKADWEKKDMIITRSAIAKSCIEANITDTKVADYWLAWVLQKPTGNPGREAPQDEPSMPWGEEPPPFDDDIPF